MTQTKVRKEKGLLIICEDLWQMKRPQSSSKGMFQNNNKDVSSSDDSVWTTRPEKNILKLAEMNMANELNSAKTSKALVRVNKTL